MKRRTVVFRSVYGTVSGCSGRISGGHRQDAALLFLAYLLIEYIETRHGERIEALLAGGGRWGAIPGAVLGCVPQCGFSAIASNFYSSRVITLGTLMAVYLATSDEAIPLLVSMPAYWNKLAVLMVIKVVYAIVVGFVLDFVLRGVLPKSLRGGYTGHADEVDCHEEHNDEEGKPAPIWKAALRHTLEIFVFIFAFSLVFGLIVEGVGEDVFADLLGSMGFFQPVVAALVGLIPNCAASVLLTQLYVEGALRFSSLVAGLCTGAGVGLAVLWRTNPSWKQNLFITGLTWGCRRIPRRGNAGGRGRVCVITRRSCKENSIVKQNKAIAWNSVQ